MEGTILMTIEDRLFLDKFKADTKAHLKIIDPKLCQKCKDRQCTYCCPAHVYILEEDGSIRVSYEGCLECGTCRIICQEFKNIEWKYPRGGFGIIYRYG